MAHCCKPQIPLTERCTLTMGEVAALTGLSVATLYALRARGALRSVKIGGRRLVPRDALDELLGKRGAQQPQPEPEPEPPPSPPRSSRRTKARIEGASSS